MMQWCSRIIFTLLVLTFEMGYTDQGNFFANPSFEDLQEPDQFGRVFRDWDGWVYEGPARLAVGNIARSGTHSYELIADGGGKVRLLSRKMELPVGRYQVRIHIRGLSVGNGSMGHPLDFSVGLDGRYFPLVVSGSFGWRPVTYVFDVEHQVNNFQLSVGLLGGGWLWIDDVSLTRVGDEVPITLEPEVGREEGPAVPPVAVGRDTGHCPECGYNCNLKDSHCRACGHVMEKTHGKDLPPVKTIADFEDGAPQPVAGGSIVSGNSPQGRYSLAIDKLVSIIQPQDWSGYDYFRFDVVNPSDSPVPFYVEVRDARTRGYWTRVNHETIAPPGASTLSIPTRIYVGEKSRPGRPLLRDKITHLFINPNGKRLLIDNLRLERINAQAAAFPGLVGFDFGPMDSPVMEGFQQVTIAMPYEKGRGFGWEKADLWRSFDSLQPDPLYQDFICLRNGSFRVDLPNGRYRVRMNIDSPGGYWGEVQAYSHRSVKANGATVVDEGMDLAGFTNRYFRNAEQEDLPGVDTFENYVERMFAVKEFEVVVTDGMLDLAFQGEGFAISLSSLVIYPVDKSAEGAKFTAWLTERRRAHFNDSFRQIVPKPTGTAAPVGNYILFSRPFMKPVNAFDGPMPGEEIPSDGLSVTVAPGEEAPLTFSLQPGENVGDIDISVSKLIYDGRRWESIRSLPAAVLNPGWLDHRISRVTMDGSVYTVQPRYWHPLPAPAAEKVTRTFWLRVKAPPGSEPGVYRGNIVVRPHSGSPRNIPVTLKILPFALDPISDVAVGPWGSSITLPWQKDEQEKKDWNWRMFGKSIDVLKEAGCTSFSGIPHLRARAEGGKISLDTTVADREMALIRAKGFGHLISSYGVDSLGYRMYGNDGGPDEGTAQSAGFANSASFLKTLYSAIDEHAVANSWLPLAWNICDEPGDEALKGATANALAHRRAGEGLRLTTFMGATSIEGDDPRNPHYELVKALPIPTLNNHDEHSLTMARLAGNSVAIYNDGNRWTYGRYLKMLVLKHDLALRLGWHFNNTAGDPYYALDCREDDYCWFNTNARQDMVPSVPFLAEILPGLNDYRYLSTLERLLRERPNHSAAPGARRVWEEMMAIRAGEDRHPSADVARYEEDRAAITMAIESLLRSD